MVLFNELARRPLRQGEGGLTEASVMGVNNLPDISQHRPGKKVIQRLRSVKQGTGYERGRSGDRRIDEGMDRALGLAKANSKRKCRKER